MSVEVCTVWAPRPNHPKWRNDYLELLRLQKRTAEGFGHQHLVVTDADLGADFNQLHVELPEQLMPAMIAGVIERLRTPGRMNTYIVFVDADVLIARDLHDAFKVADFELGLTRRENDVAPINNGTMYVRLGAHHLAAQFFDLALSYCGDHWGGDQEAISRAAAPVPVEVPRVELRGPLRVGFLSMRSHGVVPTVRGARHKSGPFAVHFKGAGRKEWAWEYAQRFIFPKQP